MAADRKKSAEESQEGSASRSNPVETWRQFEDAYRQYVRALEDAQAEGQRRYAEACRSYAQSQQSTQSDVQRRYEEVYRRYIGTMQEAWGKEDARQRAENAQKDLMKSFEEERATLQSAGEQAHKQCAEALQQSAQQVQRRMQDAFQNYLKALQRAWSEADINAVDSGLLASISQSMIAAASINGRAVASARAQSH